MHDRTDKFLEHPLAPLRRCRDAAGLAKATQKTKWLSCDLLEIDPEALPLFDYIHASLCCATCDLAPCRTHHTRRPCTITTARASRNADSPMSHAKHQRTKLALAITMTPRWLRLRRSSHSPLES